MPATKKKKVEYKMLEPGTYAGAVTKAEHAVSANGNPMIKACVLVPHPEISSEEVTFVHDNIMLIPSGAWRLPGIAAAIGCPPEKLIDTMRGTVVSIEVVVESSTKYDDKNVIQKWLPATNEQKEAFAARDGGSGGGGGGRVTTKEGNEALEAILGSIPGTSTVSDSDIPF
jgi:hypothetical protein